MSALVNCTQRVRIEKVDRAWKSVPARITTIGAFGAGLDHVFAINHGSFGLFPSCVH
jgi:hypothetical protein